MSYVIALAQFDSSGGEPYSHLAVGGGVLATLVCGRYGKTTASIHLGRIPTAAQLPRSQRLWVNQFRRLSSRPVPVDDIHRMSRPHSGRHVA